MLLVVAHDGRDRHVAQLHHLADRFHGAEEVVAALGTGWQVGFAGTVEGRRPDGADGPGIDVLVQPRRG
jgi:hypothetical protein